MILDADPASSRAKTTRSAPYIKTLSRRWDCNDNLIHFHFKSAKPFLHPTLAVTRFITAFDLQGLAAV
jgi:hypothetical protein